MAALPGTKITVRNVATQVGYNTVADAEGNYRVLALPIGTYKVTAEHEGFAALVTEPRTLQINQQERMDLRLAVGALSETINVTGAGTNVETVNPTLGQSVTARPIVNLPLNGRNVLTLALLQPEVLATAISFFWGRILKAESEQETVWRTFWWGFPRISLRAQMPETISEASQPMDLRRMNGV